MIDHIKLWVDLVQSIFLIGLGLFAWLAGRTKANRESIEQIKAGDAAQNNRIGQIEARLENAISHNDFGRLNARIARIEGETQQINRSIQMISEHLLGRDK